MSVLLGSCCFRLHFQQVHLCKKKKKDSSPPVSVRETQSTSETPMTINRFNMLFQLFFLTSPIAEYLYTILTPRHFIYSHYETLQNVAKDQNKSSIYCYLCRSGSELNSTPDVFYSQSQTSASEIKFKQSSFFSGYEMINIKCLISVELESIKKFKYKFILI